MNLKEEQRLQEIDRMVKEICAKLDCSCIEGTKILLDWCEQLSDGGYKIHPMTKVKGLLLQGGYKV